MKILSWNCRGLAQSSTIRSLRAMIRKSVLDIIFLPETKSAHHVVSFILTPLGFTLVAQAPPSSSRGGILLAWKTDVKLTPVFISNARCYSNSVIP
jgi:exonuclease III